MRLETQSSLEGGLILKVAGWTNFIREASRRNPVFYISAMHHTDACSARRSTSGHNDPTEVLDWNEISWKVFHCRSM